jgi:predicted nucleic acid-binding protein
MLIVDASCLFHVVADAAGAEVLRSRFEADEEQAAPHIVDVEVLGIVRLRHQLGELDDTAAAQAVDDLRSWPGERYSHGPFLERAWELRANVRTWDAMYVALAEALGATLLTLDERLARASGPRCPIEVVLP